MLEHCGYMHCSDSHTQSTKASTHRHTPRRIGGRHCGRIGSYTTGVVVVDCRMFLPFLQQILFVGGIMLTRVQHLRWRCHFEQFETRMKRFEKGNGNCSETWLCEIWFFGGGFLFCWDLKILRYTRLYLVSCLRVIYRRCDGWRTA
jgi:hypothetical protein